MTNHDPVGQNFTEMWSPNCSIPSTDTWSVTSSCTVNASTTMPASVKVTSGAVLRVPFGISLKINFSQYNLTVNSGGGVLIDGSSDPNQPTVLGGAVKCPTC